MVSHMVEGAATRTATWHLLLPSPSPDTTFLKFIRTSAYFLTYHGPTDPRLFIFIRCLRLQLKLVFGTHLTLFLEPVPQSLTHFFGTVV